MSSNPAPETENDESIGDDEVLYRWINPEFYNADEDRPTSQAFQNSPGTNAMSVFLKSVLDKAGRPPEDLVRDKEGFGVVALTASIVRSHGQGVVRVPELGDEAHAHVIGLKKSKTWKRQIPPAAEWIRRPTAL